MGKRTLSNTRTRVSLRYERRLLRRLSKLGRRMDALEHATHVQYVSYSYPGDISSQLADAAMSAVNFSAGVQSTKQRSLWSRASHWWIWRYIGMGWVIGTLIAWGASYVD
jgi:hypothetical protein